MAPPLPTSAVTTQRRSSPRVYLQARSIVIWLVLTNPARNDGALVASIDWFMSDLMGSSAGEPFLGEAFIADKFWSAVPDELSLNNRSHFRILRLKWPALPSVFLSDVSLRKCSIRKFEIRASTLWLSFCFQLLILMAAFQTCGLFQIISLISSPASGKKEIRVIRLDCLETPPLGYRIEGR